ncbi:MAG: beta-lactamase family protein [Gammaproteobacteria bacterium]|nr:beta-lactamase family protein [Gammaproteobacteria bacterium]
MSGLVAATETSIYPPPGSQYSIIHKKVIDYVGAHPDVSLSLALIRGDHIEWAHSYHTAAISKNIYRVGSIAKVFTALAVMQLEDQGLIDIDQPVFAYLPRFSVKRRFSNVRPITIRHLLTHHSGLPTNIVKGQWSHAHFSTVIEQLRNEYMSYPPEFVRAYSNIGYALLGALIEEVTGQDYESYIEDNIFTPLEMTDSGFDGGVVQQKNFIWPQETKNSQRLLPIRDVPAMGLYTTAEDMSKFISMLSNKGRFKGKDFIHYSVLEEMMERNNAHVTLDYDQQQGIGLLLNHCILGYPGDVVEHGGNTMYYASHFVSAPAYGIGAVVLSNSRAAKNFIHMLARDLAATAIQKYYPEDKLKSTKKPDKPLVAKRDADSDVSRSGIMQGKYLTRSGLLTLQVDESDMCACVDKKRLDLIPMPDGWYGVKNQKKDASLTSIEFSPQEVEGQAVLAIRKGDREQRLGEYIPESGIPSKWKDRLGDYKVENPDPEFPLNEVSLIEEDNLMYLSYRMPLLSNKRIEIPLTALDDGQAITTGMGRGRGETVLAQQTSEGEYLLYSGYLIKKVVH